MADLEQIQTVSILQSFASENELVLKIVNDEINCQQQIMQMTRQGLTFFPDSLSIR